MFEEMLEVARDKLATINEIVDGLPAAQVTILLSNNNIFRNSINILGKNISTNKNAFRGEIPCLTSGVYNKKRVKDTKEN